MEIIIFILIAFFVVFIVAPGLGAILGLISIFFGSGAPRGSASDKPDSDIEGGRP